MNGSIYNDVDRNPSNLLHDGEQSSFCFSLTSNINEVLEADTRNIVQESVASAVLEADRVEGVAYEDLVFDTDCFDVESEATDPSYMEKVHHIATKDPVAWKNLVISDKALKVFEYRINND